MNIPDQNRHFIRAIVLIIMLFGLMYCMYLLGYHQTTSEISKRMHQFDNKGEECYTREEVDSFIYGDRWTEVY